MNENYKQYADSIGIATEINRQKFPIGSVAYYVDTIPHSCKETVYYGIVEENYINSVALHLLDLKKNRFIDGVSEYALKTPTRWQKLPKGWTYDTELFKLTEQNNFKKTSQYHIDNPEDILAAYRDGILVYVEDNDYCTFRSEVDKDKGWRVIRDYFYPDYHPSHISVSMDNIFATYQEAQAKVDKIEEEFKKQSEMTDHDWAIKDIDDTIASWGKFFNKTDTEKKKVRDFLLSQGPAENIEVRHFGENMQWKYIKNRKWLDVVV